MSYRCQICDAAVPSGTPRRVIVVYRDDKIVGEVPACWRCRQESGRGLSVAELLAKYRKSPSPPQQSQQVIEPEELPVEGNGILKFN
jgi:hypothetical protein